MIIPGVNDRNGVLTDMTGRIAGELGPETPGRSAAMFRLTGSGRRPRRSSTLERARTVGHRTGLRYLYLGNVPGHPAENTYCAGCRELLIERWGFDVVGYRILQGRCPNCGEAIPGVGWGWAEAEDPR